ncbi:MAG: DUF2764 domain-containing protein [Treponema sp.]|nr:DUF2764 domain-containing protein [Treponema sp.]
MGSYYYLAAQLPDLVYGQSAPMTSAAFLDLAGRLLDKEDSALLDKLSLDPGDPSDNPAGLPGSDPSRPAYAESAAPSGCDFIDKWREWERSLRLNLARNRALHLKREGGSPVDPPAHPLDAAAVALKAGVSAGTPDESPLETEIALDKARWNAIEHLQGITYFSRNTVYAYFLKLLLLERRESFNTEAGFAEYKSLYASILERAQQGVSPAGEPK